MLPKMFFSEFAPFLIQQNYVRNRFPSLLDLVRSYSKYLENLFKKTDNNKSNNNNQLNVEKMNRNYARIQHK